MILFIHVIILKIICNMQFYFITNIIEIKGFSAHHDQLIKPVQGRLLCFHLLHLFLHHSHVVSFTFSQFLDFFDQNSPIFALEPLVFPINHQKFNEFKVWVFFQVNTLDFINFSKARTFRSFDFSRYLCQILLISEIIPWEAQVRLIYDILKEGDDQVFLFFLIPILLVSNFL